MFLYIVKQCGQEDLGSPLFNLPGAWCLMEPLDVGVCCISMGRKSFCGTAKGRDPFQFLTITPKYH